MTTLSALRDTSAMCHVHNSLPFSSRYPRRRARVVFNTLRYASRLAATMILELSSELSDGQLEVCQSQGGEGIWDDDNAENSQPSRGTPYERR